MIKTITPDEEKEIAERTRQSPEVIMAFFDWYGRYIDECHDDAMACQLALLKQNEVFSAVYSQKQQEYLADVERNYRIRLAIKKKWQSGCIFLTKSGIKVRSKIEKIIADFLHDHRLRFVYEPIVNLNGFYVTPDFYLPDYDLFLEHLGLDEPNYQQSAQKKLARFARYKIRVIATHSNEEPIIEEVLTEKLREAGVPLQTLASAGSGINRS